MQINAQEIAQNLEPVAKFVIFLVIGKMLKGLQACKSILKHFQKML